MQVKTLAVLLFVLSAGGALGAGPSAGGGAKLFVQNVPGSEVTFEMLPIPGGRFLLGSPGGEKGRRADEGPQVEVEVEPFYMGKYEVTWPEYNLFLHNYHRAATQGVPQVPESRRADAVTYPTPLYEMEAGPQIERMGRGPEFPAVLMSQFAAKQYTKWLSKKSGRFYRLPTEAEWEYACRAGTATAFGFGDDSEQLRDYAWFFDNSALGDGDGAYRKVGRKRPNAWGLYDMHGNVAEWVIDAHAADWYGRLAGPTVRSDAAVNWPTELYPRVIRGGSYMDDPADCRSASRFVAGRDINSHDPCLPQSPHWASTAFWVGFRIVSPIKEPSEEQKMQYWNADDAYTKKILERDREIHEIIPPP